MKHSLLSVAAAFVAVALGVVFAIDPASAMSLAGAVALANFPLALDPDKVNAELKRIGDEVKAFGEKAMAEIKSSGKLSAETRAEVDKLLTKQGELQAELRVAEQSIADLRQRGSGGGAAKPLSLGEQVGGDESYLAWASRPHGSFRMSVQAKITSVDGSGGDLIVPDRVPGIIPPGLRRLTVRDLITWGRTSSNSVEFARELLFTNAAAPVSENPAAGKPESNITFEADSAPVATIAHWVHASRQVLADVPMLQSYIDGRLRHGLKLVEEAQLLKGSGVGLNIEGIYTQATAYANPGVSVQAETRLDRLRLALLQVELAEYWADGIVISPIDWAAIELTKTMDNAYLFANPRAITTPGLWGRNVVPTQAMDAGEFLVGAFGGGLAVQGWDREDVNVQVSLEDRDNFIKNMVTIRCEERLALTVYRPSSFVKGAFDDLDSI